MNLETRSARLEEATLADRLARSGAPREPPDELAHGERRLGRHAGELGALAVPGFEPRGAHGSRLRDVPRPLPLLGADALYALACRVEKLSRRERRVESLLRGQGGLLLAPDVLAHGLEEVLPLGVRARDGEERAESARAHLLGEVLALGENGLGRGERARLRRHVVRDRLRAREELEVARVLGRRRPSSEVLEREERVRDRLALEAREEPRERRLEARAPASQLLVSERGRSRLLGEGRGLRALAGRQCLQGRELVFERLLQDERGLELARELLLVVRVAASQLGGARACLLEPRASAPEGRERLLARRLLLGERVELRGARLDRREVAPRELGLGEGSLGERSLALDLGALDDEPPRGPLALARAGRTLGRALAVAGGALPEGALLRDGALPGRDLALEGPREVGRAVEVLHLLARGGDRAVEAAHVALLEESPDARRVRHGVGVAVDAEDPPVDVPSFLVLLEDRLEELPLRSRHDPLPGVDERVLGEIQELGDSPRDRALLRLEDLGLPQRVEEDQGRVLRLEGIGLAARARALSDHAVDAVGLLSHLEGYRGEPPLSAPPEEARGRVELDVVGPGVGRAHAAGLDAVGSEEGEGDPGDDRRLPGAVLARYADEARREVDLHVGEAADVDEARREELHSGLLREAREDLPHGARLRARDEVEEDRERILEARVVLASPRAAVAHARGDEARDALEELGGRVARPLPQDLAEGRGDIVFAGGVIRGRGLTCVLVEAYVERDGPERLADPPLEGEDGELGPGEGRLPGEPDPEDRLLEDALLAAASERDLVERLGDDDGR